jgi:hypothetical protein
VPYRMIRQDSFELCLSFPLKEMPQSPSAAHFLSHSWTEIKKTDFTTPCYDLLANYQSMCVTQEVLLNEVQRVKYKLQCDPYESRLDNPR